MDLHSAQKNALETLIRQHVATTTGVSFRYKLKTRVGISLETGRHRLRLEQDNAFLFGQNKASTRKSLRINCSGCFVSSRIINVILTLVHNALAREKREIKLPTFKRLDFVTLHTNETSLTFFPFIRLKST